MTRFHKLLRLAFYVLVTATLILWLLSRYQGLEPRWWIYCGLAAVGCSMVRFFTRLS